MSMNKLLSASQLGSLLAACRKGCTERDSAKKKAANLVTVRIRWMRHRGQHEAADALYRATWPDRWAARQLRAQAGL